MKVGVYDGPVGIHFVRVTDTDLGVEEGLRVCEAAASIACFAVDVVRGRLAPEGLYRFMTAVSVSRLLVFGQLAQDDPDPGKPWGNVPGFIRLKAIFCSKAPVVPLRVRAMAFDADRADLVVSLAVGEQHCWVCMRWLRRGGRWVCDLCDIG